MVDEVVHKDAAEGHDTRQGGDGAVAHFDGPDDVELIVAEAGEGGAGFCADGVELSRPVRQSRRRRMVWSSGWRTKTSVLTIMEQRAGNSATWEARRPRVIDLSCGFHGKAGFRHALEHAPGGGAFFVEFQQEQLLDGHGSSHA